MAKRAQTSFNQTTSFELLRYQVAVAKTIPIDMLVIYGTKEQIRADKNNIFQKALTKKKFHLRVNSLVDHSADGGGNISLKVAGKRKLLHTAQAPEEFNIDKQLLEGNIDWEKLNEKFKNILI